MQLVFFVQECTSKDPVVQRQSFASLHVATKCLRISFEAAVLPKYTGPLV